MTRCTLLLLFSLATFFNAHAQGELVSMEKLKTFTKAELDDIQANAGNPFVTPALYEVDYYKVYYKTPYLHPDSLVTVTMGLAIPVMTECEVPIACYAHGTQADNRNGASTMDGGQWEVGAIFSGSGYTVAMPDYLGLGDSDSSIIIHPYTHSYSQANTMINAVRASRHVLDSLSTTDNGQIFLFGYSQGGHATAACVKEMEALYPNEFEIAGSAPMSGAYDTKVAQVELMADTNPYPTPGYLPYIVLSYQSIYGNLYTDISNVMKSPWDTLIPPLFYGKDKGIGFINNQCDPVPRNMVVDTTFNNFFSNPLHPLRVALADNDLVEGWAPQSPMRMYFCTGDDQVSSRNSDNAYAAWTTAGAPQLDSVNFGGFDHNGCAPFCFIAAKSYFDDKKRDCTVGINNPDELSNITLYPNPTSGVIMLEGLKEEAVITVTNLQGQLINRYQTDGSASYRINMTSLSSGLYLFEIRTENGISNRKVIVN